MKILVISRWGDVLDICIRLQAEGEQVKLWLGEKLDTGDGMIEKIKDWYSQVNWADLIIFADADMGHYANHLRKQNKRVFGGSVMTDKLENERDTAIQELNRVGIKPIPSEHFNSSAEGIKFIQKNPDTYVLKPNGQTDRHLTYVGEDKKGLDVIDELENYDKKKLWQGKVDYILQKKVDGIEIDVATFWDGKQFAKPYNISFENKKTTAGNNGCGMGINCGEMGSYAYHSETSKLFDKTISKFKDFLTKSGYRGWFDLSLIVNGENIYPLEFTNRLPQPEISIQEEIYKDSWGKIFFDCASGNMPRFNGIVGEMALGIFLCSAGHPFNEVYKKIGKGRIIRLKNITDEDIPHIHFYDVKMEDGNLVTSDGDGEILLITSRDKEMKEAQKKVYTLADKIKFPTKFFRNDIGNRWFVEKDKLASWGYLN